MAVVRFLTGALLSGALLTGGVAAANAGDTPGNSGVYTMSEEDLAALREAVSAFPNPEAAVEGGRADLDLCLDHMGSHFADPATFADAVIDPVAPEALVYAEVDGAQQLVAVEWVSTAPGQVLGIPMHLNHEFDLWVLHAWIGLENPSGMHADHNPDVGECPA